MPHLMLVALLALSGCNGLRYVTGNGWVDVPGTRPGAGPVVITIDGSKPSLCGPDDTDPQHTCPAQSGPDQR
jgi:hypothetical protein